VIIFGSIPTLSVLIKGAGRPAHEDGTTGKAIVHIKRSDLALQISCHTCRLPLLLIFSYFHSEGSFVESVHDNSAVVVIQNAQ